jgi:uncharacterized protein (TIGR02391 family)
MKRSRAKIPASRIPSSIEKLKRRLTELTNPDFRQHDVFGESKIVANKVNATIDDVFGADSVEALEFRINSDWFVSLYEMDVRKQIDAFHRGYDRSSAVLQSAIERLEEQLADEANDKADQVLQAYERLDLHPEIARASSDLYRDGHYANAIEDAVKALNNLVRLRSGLELDGAPLMETAFSPKKPKLQFNELRDQSDTDEQKGFMMMFSGAVAGLRNPRAHRIIQDDPERALEFIAFVSLLAKLLDQARKGPGLE